MAYPVACAIELDIPTKAIKINSIVNPVVPGIKSATKGIAINNKSSIEYE